MKRFLDEAFDDTLFTKMSSDDQIDSAHCRKAFNIQRVGAVDEMRGQSTLKIIKVQQKCIDNQLLQMRFN